MLSRPSPPILFLSFSSRTRTKMNNLRNTKHWECSYGHLTGFSSFINIIYESYITRSFLFVFLFYVVNNSIIHSELALFSLVHIYCSSTEVPKKCTNVGIPLGDFIFFIYIYIYIYIYNMIYPFHGYIWVHVNISKMEHFRVSFP